MQNRISITSDESHERWQAIVTALVAHGINPDIVTFAALSLGADAIAQNLGIEKAQRIIGFIPSKEGR